MANIWRKDDNVKEQPKRNIMDLSFQNNLTTQFGKLVPVFCKEFIPGDSFSIQPTFSLKFQPMVFPIQTRMRAYLHFFKVRNRNLWKDWEDFIAKNKENLDPPYLDTAVTKPTTGSLLDYLGVPTTIVGGYGTVPDELIGSPTVGYSKQLDPNYYDSQEYPSSVDEYIDSIRNCVNWYFNAGTTTITDAYKWGAFIKLGKYSDLKEKLSERKLLIDASAIGTGTSPTDYPEPAINNVSTKLMFCAVGTSMAGSTGTNVSIQSEKIFPKKVGNYLSFDLRELNVYNPSDNDELYVVFPPRYLYTQGYPGQVSMNEYVAKGITIDAYYSNDSSVVNDIDADTSPYWSSYTPASVRERIKLSALPCRAYEQIYNSFYRNAENNPYILNGVPEYNKYMPTDEGGVDANKYDFYYRNWEDDFLTTALQQPQAGIAPLVGLTGTAGTATVTLADDDGNVSEATAQYDEDGNVLSVTSATNTSLTEALADAVTYGISINDLRNVNAFQRWLEAKARGGYKYRDVIETMFGITVRYDTLDMPEFIGGTSLDIMVNQISQTVPTETSPLGDYAGQASGIGTGKEINEYFDEHGFVVGILSVVPVPNYSQLLPKHFIKRDAFDYYFPQFGHIGMQPIKYDEVCPIQAYQDSTSGNNVLDDTFGYQRAWYDYLASTDEVHGEFRTNLRNFVMNRTFDVKPELVNSFLTVDPKQLNDVFAIQDDSYDKILGQIYFNVKAKRPIPLYGIPKLE